MSLAGKTPGGQEHTTFLSGSAEVRCDRVVNLHARGAYDTRGRTSRFLPHVG
jgi:hypothetical protein